MIYSAWYFRAVTYGSMGATVGHEVAHGFDNEGMQTSSS